MSHLENIPTAPLTELWGTSPIQIIIHLHVPFSHDDFFDFRITSCYLTQVSAHRFLWTTSAFPLGCFHSMWPFVLAAHSQNYHFNVPLTLVFISAAIHTVKNETENVIPPCKKQLLLKSVYKNCFLGQLWAWGWSGSRYFRLRWWFLNLSGLETNGAAGGGRDSLCLCE